MQLLGNKLRFSASDLVGHVDCHHLTALDIAAVRGKLKKPKPWDPLLQILAERGFAHEWQYVEHLRKALYGVGTRDGYALVMYEQTPGIPLNRSGN